MNGEITGVRGIASAMRHRCPEAMIFVQDALQLTLTYKRTIPNRANYNIEHVYKLPDVLD